MTSRPQPPSPWLQDHSHPYHDIKTTATLTMTSRPQPPSPWHQDHSHPHHDIKTTAILTMTSRPQPSSPWHQEHSHPHHDIKTTATLTMTSRPQPSLPWHQSKEILSWCTFSQQVDLVLVYIAHGISCCYCGLYLCSFVTLHRRTVQTK